MVTGIVVELPSGTTDVPIMTAVRDTAARPPSMDPRSILWSRLPVSSTEEKVIAVDASKSPTAITLILAMRASSVTPPRVWLGLNVTRPISLSMLEVGGSVERGASPNHGVDDDHRRVVVQG